MLVCTHCVSKYMHMYTVNKPYVHTLAKGQIVIHFVLPQQNA